MPGENTWTVKFTEQKIDAGDSILIAGLPGIGNVGKIVADFLVDQLKAVKVCEFYSYSMPHSVFVREDNLVQMPMIELYFAERDGRKLLLLTGDSQPVDEQGCYSFCEKLLDILQEKKCREIITLGGIGLNSIPKSPKIYITGNDVQLIEEYKKGTSMNSSVFGVVGPIIGVSGLLVGLSKRRELKSVSILAETFGHPMFLGLKSAREILDVLNAKLNLAINTKNLDKEIKDFESKMKISEELGFPVRKKGSSKDRRDVSYIG